MIQPDGYTNVMTQYWLMKTEPTTYSIDHLISEQTTHWEGVRNYQARNFMRDTMKVGDQVLLYHSNCKPPGIVGLGEISSKPYPDHFAWNPDSKYFDPKASPDNPIWQMVDVSFKEKFSDIISLDQLRTYPELADLMVLRKGSRLSIQPVEKKDYDFILSIAPN